MAIPVVYRRREESLIASYNSTEIASGRGVATFYLIDDSNGNRTLLTNPEMAGVGLVDNNSAVNVDFDVTLLKTIAVQGTGGIFLSTAAIGNAHTINIKASIIKVSDGVSTTLLTANKDVVYGTTGEWKSVSFFGEIAKTHFKIGDTLRLKIEIPQRASAFQGVYVIFDPSGILFAATATWKSSTSTINLPVLTNV